jgi:gluconate 2-dehydrogenase gamma chain
MTQDSTRNDLGTEPQAPAPQAADGQTADAAQEATEQTQPVKRRIDRRRFIAASAATGAGAVALPVVARQEGTPTGHGHGEGSPEIVAEDGTTGVPEEADRVGRLAGFTFFTPFQAAIVAAAADRLIPSDDNGPGASEAGVVHFIDRQLRQQDHFTSFRGPRYGLGPFVDGEETQGDQSAMEMQDRWRLGIEGMEAYAQEVYGEGFAALDPEQQERILRDMEEGIPETFGGASIQNVRVSQAGAGQESSIQQADGAGIGAEAFFQLLHAYTLAGFFADPVHGGNHDMVGWKLIGFPGAQGFVYHDWILRYGEEFTGGYQSLTAYQEFFTGDNE